MFAYSKTLPLDVAGRLKPDLTLHYYCHTITYDYATPMQYIRFTTERSGITSQCKRPVRLVYASSRVLHCKLASRIVGLHLFYKNIGELKALTEILLLISPSEIIVKYCVYLCLKNNKNEKY